MAFKIVGNRYLTASVMKTFLSFQITNLPDIVLFVL